MINLQCRAYVTNNVDSVINNCDYMIELCIHVSMNQKKKRQVMQAK